MLAFGKPWLRAFATGLCRDAGTQEAKQKHPGSMNRSKLKGFFDLFKYTDASAAIP